MKKRKKLNKKRKIKYLIIDFTILIMVLIYVARNRPVKTIIQTDANVDSRYEIIKQDENLNYSGLGQEKVKNKDGYFTTFTTTNKKTYIEYKQNGTSSWAKKGYWGGTMEDNGCGITALSIILSGYNRNYNPENLREMYYPVLNYDNFPCELTSTFKIKNTGFFYDNVHLSKEKLQEHLNSDRPVLICVWNKPNDNRWTKASHYMVLLATDDTKVYISNPNGLENDSKSSGWYDYNEIIPYIAKVLYIDEL